MCWCLILYNAAVAQDNHIRNFQVANRNSTHITFTWDVVGSNYNSTIYFRLYYQGRVSGYPSSTSMYSSTTWSSGSKKFQFTTSLRTFDKNYDEYIMWILMYRRSLTSRYTYSERKYVNIGKLNTLIHQLCILICNVYNVLGIAVSVSKLVCKPTGLGCNDHTH